MAAFAAVAAQADVTIYGILDPSIIAQKQGAAKAANGTVTSFGTSSAMDNSSQLGFKGSEDFGGGLKAIFDLQGDVTLGNGMMGNSNSAANALTAGSVGGNSTATGALTSEQSNVFNRNAYVGLVTSSGTVKIGRQFTPFHENQVNNDAFSMNSGGYLAALSQLTTTGAANFGINNTSQISAFGNTNTGVNGYGNYANGVSFELPAMNGLTLKAFQTFGNTTGLGTTNAAAGLPAQSSGITSIRALFEQGGLKLNAAFQTTRAGVAPQAAVDSSGGYGCVTTTAVGIYNCAAGTAGQATAAANNYNGGVAITSSTAAVASTVAPGQQVFNVTQFGAKYNTGKVTYTIGQFLLKQQVAGFDNVSVTTGGFLYAYDSSVDLGLEYTAIRDTSQTANTANTIAGSARYKLSKTSSIWAIYGQTQNNGNSVMNPNYAGVGTTSSYGGAGVTSFATGLRYTF